MDMLTSSASLESKYQLFVDLYCGGNNSLLLMKCGGKEACGQAFHISQEQAKMKQLHSCQMTYLIAASTICVAFSSLIVPAFPPALFSLLIACDNE
jgi:hypothetical protein